MTNISHYQKVFSIIQRRYSLSAAQAAETTKMIIDDMCQQKRYDVEAYLDYLESLGTLDRKEAKKMNEKVVAIREIMDIEQRAMKRNPPRNIKADIANLRKLTEIVLGYRLTKEEIDYVLGE